MFNFVIDSWHQTCPRCGRPLEWQTKDDTARYPLCLARVRRRDVFDFHASCDGCGLWCSASNILELVSTTYRWSELSADGVRIPWHADVAENTSVEPESNVPKGHNP